MRNYSKEEISEVALSVLGIKIPTDWSGIDAVLPLLEKIRKDGAIFIIKLDGERRDEFYTVLGQGGPLSEEYIRIDSANLDDALSFVIGNYSALVWFKSS